MSRSAEEEALLDEKIARIRAKNAQIIKRKQLIEEEIKLAKKCNAMVDTKTSKISEDDFKPSLYSDAIENEPTSFPKNLNSEPEKRERKPDETRFVLKHNLRDDSSWRAERHQIDKERIRRQKAGSSWKREWDADKLISDEECSNSITERSNVPDHSRRIRNPRTNDIHSIQDKRHTSPGLKHSRGRGRSLSDNSKSVGNQFSPRGNSALQTDRPPKAKAPLVKRVSWKSDDELTEHPKFSLKTDTLANIKVSVNNANTSARKRAVQITDERLAVKSNKLLQKFDENTSFNIKYCVAKTKDELPGMKRCVIEKTVSVPKSSNSSLFNSSTKEILGENVNPSVCVSNTRQRSSSKDADDISDGDIVNEDEWIDASDDDDWVTDEEQ